ncbi:TrmO family methyltransferase domain-containing protein [Desulfoluna spongiiphila]|uniref:tRNA-Thr(GGU) m(6)t(6)A37 methyltransferase TsaA n=1 Tax=Desulfoluna spongiiphila TaxID=419481 RepID=A0A1G5HGC1_9BACT|nr:TrmO family methyltransferase [Desulfoluna spongiiphila]SCY62902.1 tRNA-Thr(GGU) m(6)t(6)A37 methyltransferase TsaA [Desulfoluna spongiiphila]
MQINPKKETYSIFPVGRVHAEIEGGFTLYVGKAFCSALQELHRFSHVQVFWWATDHDTREDRGRLLTELPYAEGVEAGVFACRSPYRPNPIAVTTCACLQVDMARGIIRVPWIDAHDGTPIIDLKPYIPVSDRVREAVVPEWFENWPQWHEDAWQLEGMVNTSK